MKDIVGKDISDGASLEVIPREGVESLSSRASGRRRSLVIPREGVERLCHEADEGFPRLLGDPERGS